MELKTEYEFILPRGYVDKDGVVRHQVINDLPLGRDIDEMLRVAGERYPADAWNIYAAQASDGDNWPNDAKT